MRISGKILASGRGAAKDLAQTAAELFGQAVPIARKSVFELTSAMQGAEGLSAVGEALRGSKPFAMAFVDVRMPPGWDGIESTARIWEMDPDIQIVLCTVYSDYSWDEIARRLGSTDRLVILKKPFDAVEVMQLASALTEKWVLSQRLKSEFQNLEHKVADRTRELRNANQQLQAEIVQHQETEETLRATQEKLTHFLSKSPAILYSFRLEGDRILPSWVSENIAGLTGGDVQDGIRNRRG